MTEWRKASRSSSTGGECVEMRRAAGTVGLRDSKDPNGPHVTLALTAARNLLTTIKAESREEIEKAREGYA
ncbi:DUF397 domain-containing protein [Actinomadura hibisca]|uniref:DUF397 domain-containing protein n=1 Tax=Actinomadura hibisca TaxID=68565 RepID=UPI000A069FC7|nr:DUF397 domain-containing protein [Actinomadura hibisca]